MSFIDPFVAFDESYYSTINNLFKYLRHIKLNIYDALELILVDNFQFHRFFPARMFEF